MKIQVIIGSFFLVLAIIFGLAALKGNLVAQRQQQHEWLPAGKTRGFIAIVFALVGAGLVLTRLIFG